MKTQIRTKKTRMVNVPLPNGVSIPYPLPLNYIAYRVEASPAEGPLLSADISFLPVIGEMRELSDRELDTYLADRGYKLADAFSLSQGWRKFVPDADQADEPKVTIRVRKGEAGYYQDTPSELRADDLLRVFSGDGDAFSSVLSSTALKLPQTELSRK